MTGILYEERVLTGLVVHAQAGFCARNAVCPVLIQSFPQRLHAEWTEQLHVQIVSSKRLVGAGSFVITVGISSPFSIISQSLLSGDGSS